jgi:hypothetical protein
MIVIEHQPHLVSATVFGDFTLKDYHEFEALVDYKTRFEGKISLLFDLRQMLHFTLDVAWEEIRFSRQHAHDFDRIAVLTDDQWVTWTAWLSQLFVDADVQVFTEETDAHQWLAQPDPAAPNL